MWYEYNFESSGIKYYYLMDPIEHRVNIDSK